MANNDKYTDEYNDEYLCRDFFGRFQFLVEVIIPDIRISSSLVHTSSRHFEFFFKSSACIKSHLPNVENRM